MHAIKSASALCNDFPTEILVKYDYDIRMKAITRMLYNYTKEKLKETNFKKQPLSIENVQARGSRDFEAHSTPWEL